MDTQQGLFESTNGDSAPAHASSFGMLLCAYFLPVGLFLDPEAHGSWTRWSRRRHNIGVLRVYALVFARRWIALWLMFLGLGTLVGGAAGSLLALPGAFALIPGVVFICAKIAAHIVGDDLPM
jgi:hypothetical protein